MGADLFESESSGKDFDEAFHHAVEGAHYAFGHSGYSGSICEKPGAYLIPTPKGTKAYDVMSVIVDAQGWDEPRRPGTNPDPEFAERQKKYHEQTAAAFKQVVKWFGHDEAEKIVNMSDDKWADAVGIELADDEHGRIPMRRPIPKSVRRFLFFGWASS